MERTYVPRRGAVLPHLQSRSGGVYGIDKAQV
jgi:hypothetical protein